MSYYVIERIEQGKYLEYYNEIRMDIYNIYEDDEKRHLYFIALWDVYNFMKSYDNFLYTIYKELIKKGIIISKGNFYKLKSDKYGRFNKKSMVYANYYIEQNYLTNNNNDFCMYEKMFLKLFPYNSDICLLKYLWKINLETIYKN